MIAIYTCRLCKRKGTHKLLEEFKDMPPGLGLFECYGCGVAGIQMIAIESWTSKTEAT